MNDEELAAARRRYAESLREQEQLRNSALVEAFAHVPREDYLGPGPWRRVAGMPGRLYETTPDDDPVHLYQDALFAIDESRRLNNGQPSGLARWFDLLDLSPGERVLHIGCGVGYYTAILAETVGREGQVTGLEVDPDIGARAIANLAHYREAGWRVEAACRDGGRWAPGPRDAIFVNAGATHPLPLWLDALAEGGRLLVPLTVAIDDSGIGVGHVLKICRAGDRFAAEFVSPVGVYPCASARSSNGNEALREAFARDEPGAVRSLRRDVHEPDEGCWLHGDAFCLARTAPG